MITESNPEALLNKLLQNLDLNESIVTGAFRRMGIAEEEIASAIKKYPEAAERLNRGFMDLMPTPVLSGQSDDLYRAFAREKLQHIVKLLPIRYTYAEAVASLSNESLKHPLSRTYMAAYYLALKNCLPGLAQRAIPKESEVFTAQDLVDGHVALGEFLHRKSSGGPMEWKVKRTYGLED